MINSVEQNVIDCILKLGISRKCKGFTVIVETVATLLKQPSYFNRPYMTIDRTMYDTTLCSTYTGERSIRSALTNLWLKGDKQFIYQLFGYTIAKDKHRPSVLEFIMTIADYISLEHPELSLLFSGCSDSEIAIYRNISIVLKEFGIPCNIDGYYYLRECFYLSIQNTSPLILSKGIFPLVAQKYKTTPERVNDSIRYAIKTSWKRGNKSYLSLIFGHSVNTQPSMWHFIMQTIISTNSFTNLNIYQRFSD